MKGKSSYLKWGLTIFLTVCAILVFYDTFYMNGTLQRMVSKLASILSPVLVGLVMAYLLAPIVNWIERLIRSGLGRIKGLEGKTIPHAAGWLRAVSILLTWAIVLLLLYLMFSVVIPQLVDSVVMLINNAETYYDKIYTWIVNLLAMKEQSLARCCKLLYGVCKEDHAHWIARAVRRADGIFSGFVRGKLLDSLIIGILCLIGCTLLKMPYAPLVSLIVGVTNVIPFFGPFMGAVPSAFLILLVSPKKCLFFVIFVIALQQFDGNILGPKILGNATGISSFWVVVAILVGGGFGGVLGMFLGVPVFACIQVLVKHLVDQRLRRRNMPTEAYHYVDRDQPPKPPAPSA